MIALLLLFYPLLAGLILLATQPAQAKKWVVEFELIGVLHGLNHLVFLST